MLNQDIRHSVCYEHDYLAAIGSHIDLKSSVNSPIHWIAGSFFEELFQRSADTPSGSGQWLTRDWMGRQPVLKIRHYVGLIQSRDGHTLEILPKTGKHGHAVSDLRLVLLRMLQALPDMPFKILTQSALQQLAKMPLHEVFVQQALSVWQDMLQRGVKQHYQDY
ncbi:MAG: hypothetical protein EOO68_13945 [Moraxellaceae bacterium]|nr:MAG: hypothetical protein EOO68_13945 [Moraxellaceae bacterium]